MVRKTIPRRRMCGNGDYTGVSRQNCADAICTILVISVKLTSGSSEPLSLGTHRRDIFRLEEFLASRLVLRIASPTSVSISSSLTAGAPSPSARARSCAAVKLASISPTIWRTEADPSSVALLARPLVELLGLDEQSFRRRLCEGFSRILILELISAPGDREYYLLLI